jgi:restriction system protein
LARTKETIVEAIKAVLGAADHPLTPREIHDRIVDSNLYAFHADDPISVVRTQIRRRCVGLDFPSSHPVKMFRQPGPGTYSLYSTPTPTKQLPKTAGQRETSDFQRLLSAQRRGVRERLANHIRQLEPNGFERFAGRLLTAYGFEDVTVTAVSGDGGVDGHGHLRVGLARLRVAFQCKRWRKSIQRPEVDRFRGAIQGDYDQGVFFTTSTFSQGAIAVSIRRGAVPVVLINLEGIIDLMFFCGLGVSFEAIQVPSVDLDTLLVD